MLRLKRPSQQQGEYWREQTDGLQDVRVVQRLADELDNADSDDRCVEDVQRVRGVLGNNVDGDADRNQHAARVGSVAVSRGATIQA